MNGTHLPLERFGLHAERPSAVVTLQLHRVVSGGESRLTVGGRLESGVLSERDVAGTNEKRLIVWSQKHQKNPNQ